MRSRRVPRSCSLVRVIPICTSSLNAWVMFNVGRSSYCRALRPLPCPPSPSAASRTHPCSTQPHLYDAQPSNTYAIEFQVVDLWKYVSNIEHRGPLDTGLHRGMATT